MQTVEILVSVKVYGGHHALLTQWPVHCIVKTRPLLDVQCLLIVNLQVSDCFYLEPHFVDGCLRDRLQPFSLTVFQKLNLGLWA